MKVGDRVLVKNTYYGKIIGTQVVDGMLLYVVKMESDVSLEGLGLNATYLLFGETWLQVVNQRDVGNFTITHKDGVVTFKNRSTGKWFAIKGNENLVDEFARVLH